MIHTKLSFLMTVPCVMFFFAKTPYCVELCPICRMLPNMTDLSEVLDMPWILLGVLPALDIATPQTIGIHQHLYSSKASLTPPCQYIANKQIQEQKPTVLVTFQSSSSSSGKSTCDKGYFKQLL